MKVYSGVHPEWLSRAIHLTNDGLKRFAPDVVQFVDDWREADYQVVHLIGEGSRQYMYLPIERQIVFFYCYKTSVSGGDPADYWSDVLSRSAAVLSYYDLSSVSKVPFIRTPLGVDVEIFRRYNEISKSDMALSTGYVAESECIEQFYRGMAKAGYTVYHVGHDFGFGSKFVHRENISTYDMVFFMNCCRYVNGMRVIEGFERCIVEGGLCGCRPIALYNECYTHWFEDFPIYLSEDMSFDEMVEQIYRIAAIRWRSYVSDAEREWLANKFSEAVVYPALWDNLLSVLD